MGLIETENRLVVAEAEGMMGERRRWAKVTKLGEVFKRFKLSVLR